MGLLLPVPAPARCARIVALAPTSIDSMTYRELQAACKEHGLAARGKADQLRDQLQAACKEHDLAVADGASPPPLPAHPPPSPPPLAPQKASAHPAVNGAPSVAPARASSAAPMLVPGEAAGAEEGAFGVGAQYDARGALIESADAPDHGSGADLELTILGSGACNPSPWRGASCAALRVRDSYWLFDVGEGTQVQLQKTSVRPSRIDRIFITHAHGDHCFGLPGLLCLIGRGRARSAPPVQLYGPRGLRAYVRMALGFTGTRMLPSYVVHELHGVPTLRRSQRPHDHPAWLTAPPAVGGSGGGGGGGGGGWGEVEGGSDLHPSDDARWWTLVRTDELVVSAAPVTHTVPTVGFVVSEAPKPGRLLIDKVLPRLEANREALKAEWGVRDPRALLKRVKALPRGGELALPDGSVLYADEVLGDARPGRKIVVLGDCSDARLCAPLARGADVLVHEATNAYLPQFGDRGGAAALERETARHGHSTPQMAGRTAAAFGARALVLTHFSQRYHPANRPAMRAIATLAASAARLPPNAVAAAHDGLNVPVWQRDRDKPRLPAEAVLGQQPDARDTPNHSHDE
jgi:ribonuclease Z